MSATAAVGEGAAATSAVHVAAAASGVEDDHDDMQLIPIDPSNNQIMTVRPFMEVGPGRVIVYIGSNDSTEILDPNLPPQVVKIYEKRNKMYAFCCSNYDGICHVTVNGEVFPRGSRRELHRQDMIVVHNQDNSFEYRYLLGRSNETPSEATVAAVARAAPMSRTVSDGEGIIATGAEPSRRTAAAFDRNQSITPKSESTGTATTHVAPEFPPQLSHDITCAICMEIMLLPRTIIPCGHSFCQQCAASQSSCPECRGPIGNHVTCRALQNVIDSLVDASVQRGVQIFEKEDLDSYIQRKKIADAAAIGTGTRKKRRTMQQGGGATHGAIYIS